MPFRNSPAPASDLLRLTRQIPRLYRGKANLAANVASLVAATNLCSVTHQSYAYPGDGLSSTNTPTFGADNEYDVSGVMDAAVSAVGAGGTCILELVLTRVVMVQDGFGGETVYDSASVTELEMGIFVGTAVGERATVAQQWLVNPPGVTTPANGICRVYTVFQLTGRQTAGATTYTIRSTHTNLIVVQLNTPNFTV